jgi:SAM-dependent methyltransferase
MRRFSWEESRAYWEIHEARRARVDAAEDPDWLGNVCHPGEPLWLNRYYARFQERVYSDLLSMVPTPGSASQAALEIGCGAGRWCRMLAARGYDVTGIDLQASLIERNGARFPNMRFLCTAVQDFRPAERYALISSVTVIQHNPFEEQRRIVGRITELVKPSGHVLILENVRDQGAHVFARPVDGWRRLFEEAGFRIRARQYYDYSPFSRTQAAAIRGLRKTLRWRRGEAAVSPETLLAPPEVGDRGSGLNRTLRGARRAVLGLTIAADTIVEPLFIRANLPLASVHCGFLFQAG